MKRLDQIKDDLEVFDREATGEPTMRIEWDFNKRPVFSGAFFFGAETGRPPTIEFNYPTIERWFRTLPQPQAFRRLKGLNFHELGHALYTPRDSEQIGYDLARLFNMLEDQRVERLVIERYPNSRPYLQELLSTEEFLGAVLAHGRSHVPVVERRFLDRRFAQTYGPAALDTLAEIVDSYVALGYGTPQGELTVLAGRLEALMVDLGTLLPCFEDPFDNLFPALH